MTTAFSGWLELKGPGGTERRSFVETRDSPPGIDPFQKPLRPEAFPGRWNPLREFPAELDPLALVAAAALSRAHWWQPGTGERAAGGLSVGLDGAYVAPTLLFLQQLHGGYSTEVSPSTFLQAHPSTAASLLGILFGLVDYQSTLVQGSLSGLLALSHGLDLLRTGRLSRVLVTSLSEGHSPGEEEEEPAGRLRVATAICLAPANPEDNLDGPDRQLQGSVEIEIGRGEAHPAEASTKLGRWVSGLDRTGSAPLLELALWQKRASQDQGSRKQQSLKLRQSEDSTGESVWTSARVF